MAMDQILEANRKEILRIAATYGARNVQVFGSLARGKGDPDSDLDILVELNFGRSLLDIIAMKQDLEDLLGLQVDVVTKAALGPYIREQVLEEAVSL